jgi:hypothetical protein
MGTEEDALRLASEMIQTVTTLTGEVRELCKDVKKSKHNVRVMLAIVILNVLLTAGMAVGLSIAVNANSRSSTNTTNAYSSCLSSNITRSEAKDLWLTFIDSIPPGTRPIASINALREDAVKTYAPRDCNLLR